jgi:hypothetical protein
MIDSAAAAPWRDYRSTLGEMTAAYVHGLAHNHGYVDGNKRTAAGVLMKFLGANGFANAGETSAAARIRCPSSTVSRSSDPVAPPLSIRGTSLQGSVPRRRDRAS